MELSSRSFRFFNRFLRPLGTSKRYKAVNFRVVKEEVNSELVHAFNQDTKAGGAVPVFRRALLFPARIALQDDSGIYTYANLHKNATVLSQEIAAQLLGETQRTVAYMCDSDASHVITQWAIWMTGNIAVPLTSLHPAEMLKYFITDSDASLTVCSENFENIIQPITEELSKAILVIGKNGQVKDQVYKPDTKDSKLSDDSNILTDVGKTNIWYGEADAMLIYTSGTTSKPKGVVWTHNMLVSQIASLHTAWQYSANDVVLHALPLHHIHGQLNSLNASLAAGARVRMLPKFESHTVWARLLGMNGGAKTEIQGEGQSVEAKVSVFHGVPSMYSRLCADHAAMFEAPRTASRVRDTLRTMRLACAGSAPLPEALFRRWEEISSIPLLERYGMSEVGMALSNPYRPVEERTVGCVGIPLPGVSARIAVSVEGQEDLEPLITVECEEPDTQISLEKLGLLPKDASGIDTEWKQPSITVHKENKDGEYQGELLLKGPGVFSRYWNRAPKLDQTDFTYDDWFRTGDTALFANGRFKILGRTSVDIIKTSGYKVSALQVESALLDHPSVTDVAVLGVPNENFGEIVVAVVVLKIGSKLTLRDLKESAAKKLASYQMPRRLIVIEKMPRNAMGKLDKKEIKKLYGDKLKSKK
ncbi:unnamed protein product [Diatraea saccharalis]|uniref:Acyl-CoA synthetase family member 3, mitochondrial n=1 Tax=Diatraea saccharalis TaxID=40085 RepID=A0A9N9WHH9_9NEOP|nr:unnamed protein product [Diatraea saccharalis]